MSPLKVVITGPTSAGKTTFVRSVADGDIVATEQETTDGTEKDTTTVGFDFVQVDVRGADVNLFGTPGQERFEYLWDILAEGAAGFVLLCPADDPGAVERSSTFVRRACDNRGPPLVVGITRTDLVSGGTEADPQRQFGQVATCVRFVDARDPEQCTDLLGALVAKIGAES